MQLVFEDETDFLNSQDYWKVIEGTLEGSVLGGVLGVIGENGSLQLSSANDANREALVEKIGTPESRGSPWRTCWSKRQPATLQRRRSAAWDGHDCRL